MPAARAAGRARPQPALERPGLASVAAPNPDAKVGPLARAVDVPQEEPGVNLPGGACVGHRRNDRPGEQRILAR